MKKLAGIRTNSAGLTFVYRWGCYWCLLALVSISHLVGSCRL